MKKTKTLIEVGLVDGHLYSCASMADPEEKEAALMGLVGLITGEELLTKALLALLSAAYENPAAHKKFMDEHSIIVTGLSEKI